jgi:NAD-dependent SIR2 family protein deacetylase
MERSSFPRGIHGKLSHEEALLQRQFDQTQKTKLRAAQEIVALLGAPSLSDGIPAEYGFPQFGEGARGTPSQQEVLEQAIQKAVRTHHLNQEAAEELRTVFSEFMPARPNGGTHG